MDPAEVENAEQCLFYLTQAESLQVDNSSLLKSTQLSKTSKLAQIFPFVGPYHYNTYAAKVEFIYKCEVYFS